MFLCVSQTSPWGTQDSPQFCSQHTSTRFLFFLIGWEGAKLLTVEGSLSTGLRDIALEESTVLILKQPLWPPSYLPFWGAGRPRNRSRQWTALSRQRNQLPPAVPCRKPKVTYHCSRSLSQTFATAPLSVFSIPRHYTSQAKRSKQKLLEQMQRKRFQDWEAVQQCPESPEGSLPVLFFAPDADPQLKCSALHSILETERKCPNTDPIPSKRGLPGSALADATGQFLMSGGTPSLVGFFEEGQSTHNASLFGNCSSASSDSSVDITFVRCPKNRGQEPYAGGGNQDGSHRYTGRGCALPDQAGMSHHRSLQAVQCKSKSLNGLQLDSSIAADSRGNSVELTPLKSHSSHSSHQHAKLERQSSKGSTSRKLQRSVSPLQRLEVDSRTVTAEPCRDHDKVTTLFPYKTSIF